MDSTSISQQNQINIQKHLEAQKKKEALFYSKRASQEQALISWQNTAKSWPQYVKDTIRDNYGVDIDTFDFRVELSAWYNEPFDSNLATQQVAAINQKLSAVNKYVEDLTMKALSLHNEFNAM